MLRKSSEKEISLEVWTGEDFVKGLGTKVGLEDSDEQRREKEINYPTARVLDLNASSLRIGAMLYPFINQTPTTMPDAHRQLKVTCTKAHLGKSKSHIVL